MTILYSCIARGPTILCSHQIGAGRYEHVAESMLRNIPLRSDTKTTYAGEDNNQYHCVVENGLIYLCVSGADFGKRQPYGYLAEIKRQFLTGTLGSRAITATNHELDIDFKNVLVRQMELFSSGGGSKTSALQNQVDEVKGIMTQNIEKVLERGERLEDLQSKTEDLEANAMVFQKTARKVRRKFWLKNLKMKIILFCVIFVILVTIIMIILATKTDVFKSSSSGGGAVTTTKSP